MKKILVAMLLVAIAAPSAFAGISGTAHDLTQGASTTTQICVFCHTPHGGSSTAPLWNRTGTESLTGNYSSGTFGNMNSTPDVGLAEDAALCLSCHDGASVSAAAIANAPNDGTISTAAYTWTNAAANLSSDMSNDHPIGMNFDATLETADTELNDPSALANAKLFSGMVWCSSCHDVHDDTNGSFLVLNNDGSALCLECHIK